MAIILPDDPDVSIEERIRAGNPMNVLEAELGIEILEDEVQMRRRRNINDNQSREEKLTVIQKLREYIVRHNE